MAKRMFVGALVGAVLSMATLLGAPLAAGAVTTTNCSGQLAPGRYGVVVVPAGAACFGDGGVTISNGLFIQPGATFVLGDEEHPGNNGSIIGGVHAVNPASVQIHFMSILDGITVQGGSGPFGGPFDITWNAIEDNKIRGNVTVAGYNGFWQGFIRNVVSGSVTMNNNVLVDEDGNEFVTNVISGNLACFGNSPAPQIGDSEGHPNIVGGAKLGQCTAV